MSDGPASVLDKLVPQSPSVMIGAALPGDQEAMAVAMVFKFADALFETLNSAPMLALRQRQDIQNLLQDEDADLKAAQAGDVNAQKRVDQESSGTQ
jgi:hypothetical protein